MGQSTHAQQVCSQRSRSGWHPGWVHCHPEGPQQASRSLMGSKENAKSCCRGGVTPCTSTGGGSLVGSSSAEAWGSQGTAEHEPATSPCSEKASIILGCSQYFILWNPTRFTRTWASPLPELNTKLGWRHLKGLTHPAALQRNLQLHLRKQQWMLTGLLASLLISQSLVQQL